ncbi:MAG TPA: curli assembly protein CsgF [Ignavibacteriaceae bacterium]|nr:curli assembly protein CsgF [Ignavibacteriaceae bacterium]
MKKILFLCTLVVILYSVNAYSQELVYHPINPSFSGGNPFNASWLMANATSQSNFSEAQDFNQFNNDPFADFENNLKRSILSKLSTKISEDLFGTNDMLLQGKYEFGNFLIEIIPGLDGLSVQIFDNSTGNTTTLVIPNI